MKLEDPQPLARRRGAMKTGVSTGDTLFLPRGRAAQRAEPSAGWTLPPHLQEQVPRRLRNTALLYSGAFFLSHFAPDILTGQLSQTFRTPAQWVPAVASILTGLAVAALAASPRMTWRGKRASGWCSKSSEATASPS